MTNAAQSYDTEGGTVTLTTHVLVADAPPDPVHGFERKLRCGEYACITAIDHGVGMSPSTLARAFDPYFTTCDDHRGLGLSAVTSLVHHHGGAVRVESEKEHGTRVQVLLPRLVRPQTGGA